ncbi:hypothetical protein FRC08_007859 [Ceratobasidium sp. 394]|nr:hypothetical protein FRC08_007859 [Ceratobasidium sp. 394]
MSSTQPNRNSGSMANIPVSPTGEVGVERALNDWKSWRATLTVVIQGYVAACANLTAVCASLSHQPYHKRGIETALLAIDTELADLASEEAVLRNARTSLAAARNLSTALAPIHTLPPETLANIFFMVQYPHNDTYGLPPVQQLAGVSSYWRQVAINTPSLWMCIDITTTQTDYNYVTLALDRSKNYPVDLTIIETSGGEDRHRFSGVIAKSHAFLTQASQRIRMLDMTSHHSSPGATIDMVKLWLKHGSAGVAKMLRVRSRLDESLRLNLTSAERAGEVLSSVSVLHLDEVIIPWTSTVYHNLVDLRLWFSVDNKRRISISQLATILASSLGLATLKLHGLKITPSDDWDATTVQLIHLEVLDLGNLPYGSFERLISLIPLSNCLKISSIGLEFRSWSGITHLIRDFLRGTPTRTLACHGDERKTSPRWPLSLVEVLPALEDLILYGFKHLAANAIQDMTSEHQPNAGEGESYQIIAPCLQRLYIVSSDVNLRGLNFIVSKCGAQTIYLETCGVSTTCNLDVNKIRARLIKAFPDLLCVVSNNDTTSKWPCRSIFDCTPEGALDADSSRLCW